MGGVIGLLVNGFFASQDIIALDGVNTNVKGGWVDHNYKQLYIQFAYVCATCAYTFVATAAIVKAVDAIPGLHLKTTPEGESLGLDEVEVSLCSLSHVTIPHDALQQIGEFANDYIEVRRDYSDWTPLGNAMSEQATEVPTPDTYLYGDRHGHSDLQQEIHRRIKEEPSLDPIQEKSADEVTSEVTEAP